MVFILTRSTKHNISENINLSCVIFSSGRKFLRKTASLEQKKSLSVISSLCCICLHLWQSGVDESCGRQSQEVTRCTHQPTQSPSREERLSIELQELQTFREGEQPKSATPPNRIKLLGNVVWAQLQIVHYNTKPKE